jgi:hypothetical protein
MSTHVSKTEALATIVDYVDDEVTAPRSALRLDLANLIVALDELDNWPLPAGSPVASQVHPLIDPIKGLLDGADPSDQLATTLLTVSELRRQLAPLMQTWIAASPPLMLPQETLNLDDALVRVIAMTRRLLGARPDVMAIMDDLAAMKSLAGGPADATAFHDFNVLQIAFEDIWLHMFDGNLKYAVQQLFEEVVGSGTDNYVAMPPGGALNDVAQLKEFIDGVRNTISVVNPSAGVVNVAPPYPGYTPPVPPDESPSDRLIRLINEIGTALNEPYHFDVFAENSYNYGLMLTYRQKWEPGEYQAGDLAATIPLAPGETRKFTSKRVVKESVSRKVIEKSSQTRSREASETSRAESEIMNRATTATNFKMTTHGSFNIGIGSFDVTNEFGGNTEAVSSTNKKAFHEATLKAAEEFRLERSLEVDSSTAIETEETRSGEISNPNNEITVTYLFYELQRRYRVSEYLYRARPVIMVAQAVPDPSQIDEDWLVQYQWIIARILLDESFRPALQYLTNGFAGDEVALSVIEANWQKQRALVTTLEATANREMAQRDALRELIVEQTIAKDKLDNLPLGVAQVDSLMDNVKSGNLNFLDTSNSGWSAADLEVNRRAAKTRLEYVEQALADAQDKLKTAASAFENATKEYSAAMQNKYTRHIAIDQLRIHVKQNILYYMQGIWAHEPSDQRFFRLYNLEIQCPDPDARCTPTVAVAGRIGAVTTLVNVDQRCIPGLGGKNLQVTTHRLAEIADIDNPIGYKGNYIVFPMIGDCPFAHHLVWDFIDTNYGVNDPAEQPFDPEEFDTRWRAAAGNINLRTQLQQELKNYIDQILEGTDEIVVPTGQLFIEALPGSHPLLENFKLAHREKDVELVMAKIEHDRLENLRLATRVVQGQSDARLLEDPDIEKKIVVAGKASVIA